jgi:DNA-binding response OmpR family regulator
MKIMIAEDDPVSAAALHGLLARLGHDVAVTVDGDAAWHFWSHEQTPIVVLDWMMPGIDGIEVCKRIRASKPTGYTCIIMLTAKREREDRVKALKAGVDVFITKPLNKEELIARLQVAERIIAMESAESDVDLAA